MHNHPTLATWRCFAECGAAVAIVYQRSNLSVVRQIRCSNLSIVHKHGGTIKKDLCWLQSAVSCLKEPRDQIGRWAAYGWEIIQEVLAGRVPKIPVQQHQISTQGPAHPAHMGTPISRTLLLCKASETTPLAWKKKRSDVEKAKQSFKTLSQMARVNIYACLKINERQIFHYQPVHG